MINRGVGRQPLFQDEDDYLAFEDHEHRKLLSAWPVRRSRHWLAYVNQAETEDELNALRRCSRRGTPYGDPQWVKKTCKKLGLESTLRSPGRPPKLN